MKTGDCGYILSSKCLEFVIVTFRIKKKLLKIILPLQKITLWALIINNLFTISSFQHISNNTAASSFQNLGNNLIGNSFIVQSEISCQSHLNTNMLFIPQNPAVSLWPRELKPQARLPSFSTHFVRHTVSLLSFNWAGLGCLQLKKELKPIRGMFLDRGRWQRALLGGIEFNRTSQAP